MKNGEWAAGVLPPLPVRILRFPNIESLGEGESVLDRVQQVVGETPSPPPSPRERGKIRVRPAVERMAAYTPPEDPEALASKAGVGLDGLVKLDANENPYGPSPRVAEALASFGRYHWYPDPEARAIRPLVAAYAQVDREQVLLGNGSDELIDLLCRIYLEPGDEALDCTPTFGMYRFSTELCGGHTVEVPRTADWRVDLDGVRKAITPRTKLIFVATPNNPTGNRESETAVRGLLETGLLVVLDEAYV